MNSDDDLIQEVESYTEVGRMERNTQPQTTRGDLPQATYLARTRSSTGVGASTSDAQVPPSSSCYICRDWVSQIIVKKLKLITRQYKFGEGILKPNPTNRLHLPLSGYMAFSEAIIKGGVSSFRI